MREASGVSARSPSELVDLERYPLLDLAAPRGGRLVSECRSQLGATGCCELPAFLTAAAVERAIADTEPLLRLAHHSEGPIQPYLEPADPSLPNDDPRRHLGRSALSAIAYDLFPPAHSLRRLYEWDPLMRFLAAALGEPELHRYADPLGALNVAVMEDGDELGWHFDQTDFVTSIALRSAERGGDFEYAPNVRRRDDEDYPAVHAVLSGDRSRVRRLGMAPGTLLLFQGRYSIHRVTEIGGGVPRLVALLAYDTKPGTVSSDLLRYARYGLGG